MENQYSDSWFTHFLDNQSEEKTHLEIDFLKHLLPIETHTRIIDLGCGDGRHSIPLYRAGYEVVAIDNNANILNKLQQLKDAENMDLQILELDMRDLEQVVGTYDGIISMWQSFGYFDRHQNQQIIDTMSSLLNKNGILLLDVYNKSFYKKQSTSGSRRIISKNTGDISEVSWWSSNRFHTQLNYPDGSIDHFSWVLYDPSELIQIASHYQLEKLDTYVWFEKSIVADTIPRYQISFRKA